MVRKRKKVTIGNDVVQPVSTEYAGSLPIGQAQYPIPSSNVIYLSLSTNSPAGSDSNNGLTVNAPKATLAGAISACPSGGTIVVRGGVYEQNYSGNMTKALTIQNYPGESVWFDGSKRQTTWTNNGNGTWSASLFAQFDHNIPGGYNNAINSAYPMSMWPDMVHVNGTRLNHRPDGSYSYVNNSGVTVTPPAEIPDATEFTMNYGTNKVTIGQDPTGKEVRLSSLGLWMIIRASVTVRGIGIRRYATTLTNSAASINVSAPGVVFENVVIEDCGQQSISFGSLTTSGALRHSTVRRAGALCVQGNLFRNFEISNCLVEQSNFNRMNEQPATAGIKLARVKYSAVKNNVIRNNWTMGVWFDVSCYDNNIHNNLITGNTGPGVMYEISRKAVIANNWITGSGTSGIWVLDSGDVEIYNNIIDRATAFDIRIEEDNRAGSVSAGENPDGVQTWTTHDIVVNNNVLANYTSKTGTWRLYFGNASFNESAAGYFNYVGGNVWSTTSLSSTSRMASVENSSGAAVTYTTPAAFQAAFPSQVGINQVVMFGAPTTQQLSDWSANGVAIPANIATIMGLPVGTKIVGPYPVPPTPREGA